MSRHLILFDKQNNFMLEIYEKVCENTNARTKIEYIEDKRQF